jgi:Tyrosyl-DNA phosphodiesterase
MTKTSFYEELVYFLKASTVHEKIVAKLSGFDFSKTTRFAFVHTM